MYRAFQTQAAPEVVAADIEGCHLARDIWGPTAAEFNPARWRAGALTKAQSEAFLPFGGRPFVCPAQRVFGPRMLGVLVGVLLGEVGEKWALQRDGSGGGHGGGGFARVAVAAGSRLSNEREGCRDLFLVWKGDVK